MSGTRSVGSAKPLTVMSLSIPKRSRTLMSTVGSAASPFRRPHAALSGGLPHPRYVSQLPPRCKATALPTAFPA